MLEVIALFEQHHRNRLTQLLERGPLQRAQPHIVRVVVQPVAREREREVGVRLLAQDRVPVFAGRAPQRQGIRIAAVDGAQYVEQHARVRDLVLRDRREGQIFFDVGDPAGPLAQSVTQDQLVVGQREQQRGARVTHA